MSQNSLSSRTIPIRLKNELHALLKPEAKKRGDSLGIPTFGFSTYLSYLITTHPEVRKLLKEKGLEAPK